MVTAHEPGRTAYEARFAGEKQGPRGTVDPWEMLPEEARAVWRRVETAVLADAALQGRRAICFAVAIDDYYDRLAFLEGWLRGDLSDWPEFLDGATAPNEEGADAA